MPSNRLRTAGTVGVAVYAAVLGLLLVHATNAPPGPPAQALAACAHVAEGTPCTLATSDGDDVQGTCKPDPAGAVCRP